MLTNYFVHTNSKRQAIKSWGIRRKRNGEEIKTKLKVGLYWEYGNIVHFPTPLPPPPYRTHELRGIVIVRRGVCCILVSKIVVAINTPQQNTTTLTLEFGEKPSGTLPKHTGTLTIEFGESAPEPRTLNPVRTTLQGSPDGPPNGRTWQTRE